MILSQGIPKINQKGTQERSGKRSWKLGANMGSPSNSIWAFLAPLGRFRTPFWTQLGAKGLPKSTFLAPSRQTIEKNEVQERVLKQHEKTLIFDEEM